MSCLRFQKYFTLIEWYLSLARQQALLNKLMHSKTRVSNSISMCHHRNKQSLQFFNEFISSITCISWQRERACKVEVIITSSDHSFPQVYSWWKEPWNEDFLSVWRKNGWLICLPSASVLQAAFKLLSKGILFF